MEDVETNDFDLQPQKRAAKSTIKTQINNLSKIKEKRALLTESKINPTFDRLKFGIDLEKYGKEIEFRVGKELKAAAYPYLPPYEQKRRMKGFKNNKAGSVNKYQEYDEEINSLPISKNKIYPNLSISYRMYQKSLGINNVYIMNNKLVIDITGKLMADYGDLGLLHIDNIKDALIKLQELGLFSFNIEKFLKRANYYLGDYTLDLYLQNPETVNRIIKAMSSYYPLYSNTHSLSKYKRHGLFYRRKAEEAGKALSVYDKGEELSHNYANPDKRVIYTDKIGEEGEYIAKRTLRLELHLSKLESTRKALGLKDKGYGYIPLLDVLTSKKPVILDELWEIGIRENKIYDALTCYEPNEDILSDDEVFSSEEAFKKMLITERLCTIIQENNYDFSRCKDYILTEYNIKLDSILADKITPMLRDNLYYFLSFRRPKTQTLIIILLTRICDIYFGEDHVPGETMYVKTEDVDD